MNNTTIPHEVKLLYEVGSEAIVFCITGISLWLLFACFLYREQINFKKRRRGLAKFHEVILDDDDDVGTTKYMVSFFSSGDYEDPPSGTVLIHLLGSIFPGRFHELRTANPEEDYQLFSPLGCEKFLITEDVRLGRLIGITLQTELEGPHPYWNCSTVIVRDVKTNEAWFFRINREIGFPPRLFQPFLHDELCSFKLSFCRRLRREVRNGQFGYFSFLFRSKLSVFTNFQRWVTSTGLYLFFFVTCFLFIDFVFSPGHSSRNPTKYGKIHKWLNPNPIRTNPNDPSRKILYGESAASYWILHVLVPALISATITTIIGGIMIALFREPSKYETRFDEMDYAIGTALLEQARLKEAAKNKFGVPLPPFPEPSRSASLDTQVETDVNGDIIDEYNDGGSNLHIYYPVGHDDPEPGRTSTERVTATRRLMGMLKGLTKTTLVLMKLRRPSTLEESQGHTNDIPEIEMEEEDDPLQPTGKRSVKFASGIENQSPPVLTSELTPFMLRQRMRCLFVGVDDTIGNVRRRSGSMGNFRLNSQVFMAFNLVEVPKGRKITYDLAVNRPNRKWYQPVAAWIVVLIVILLSIAFITVVSVKGKFHKNASEEQFLQTLLATLVVGILVGTFISEPVKICIIALYHAVKDRKIYQRIQKKTEKQNNNLAS